MSLQVFHEEINDFQTRIIESLNLQSDSDLIICSKRKVLTWLCQESQRLKDEKERLKNQGFFTGFINNFGKGSKEKLELAEQSFNLVKTFITGDALDKTINFQKLEIPEQISKSLMILKNSESEIPKYYGAVKGPLLQNLYLRKRQDFNICIEKVVANNLKFLMIEPGLSHKYQRNLVQELFGRVFRNTGSLSVVMKIQVDNQICQKAIQMFCYIEDLKFKEGILYMDLNQIKINKESNFQLEVSVEDDKNKSKILKIDEKNILTTFLSEILVVPVQTLVPDYIVGITEESASIIKYHKGSEQQIGQSIHLKEHPSIRNPLFYFRSYINGHEIANKSLEEAIETKLLYANFYQSLNILVELMLTDFHFKYGDKHINSLSFNYTTFQSIWKIFHQIVLIIDWVEQVINPIKDKVTIKQIINRFCPIFNEMANIEEENIQKYKSYMLNLQVESYLATMISKGAIEKYKDIFVNLNNYSEPKVYLDKTDIYENMFALLMDDFDVNTCNIYEAIYFLNFIANNKMSIYCLETEFNVHHSWKERKIWKLIYKEYNQEELPYVNMNLDILGLRLGIDTIQLSKKPFNNIKNQEENSQNLNKILILIHILKKNYQKKQKHYLEFMLQKAFKYKKYKIAKLLIENDVQLSNFQEIFDEDRKNQVKLFSSPNRRKSYMMNEKQKDNLIEMLHNRQPQMHRKYKWEELINVTLKRYQLEDEEEYLKLESIRRGTLVVRKEHYREFLEENFLENNISRKDYMFSSTRKIGKLKLNSDVYVEMTQYPLLKYFYFFFLKAIGKSPLLPNFCSFFNEKGSIIHLIQCIPKCLNFQKGCGMYLENQLKNFTNVDDFSEAIILSIMLMPTNLNLKNIILSTTKVKNKSLFIVDFHDFYQKDPIEKVGNIVHLKVRNSLFFFDEMSNQISFAVMKKYSNINIIEIITEVFTECSKLINEVNHMKKNKQISQENRQLLSIIFQPGFIFNLTQRMFKIKQIFQKSIQLKECLSHMKLLQQLHPSLAYYYQQIISSSNSLIERQKLLNDVSWKKPAIITQSCINFFSNSTTLEEIKHKFPNHYLKFCFEGPTESLNNLYHSIKKFTIYTEKIQDLKNYSHCMIQYLMKNVDLWKYTKEEKDTLTLKLQERSFQYLKNQKQCLPLTIIKIRLLEVFKEKNFKFSHERLKELILEDIKECSSSELNFLLKTLTNVSILRLNKVRKMQKIGELSLYMSSTMQMKNLRFLSIVDCLDIQIIDIQCISLQSVIVRNNPSLQSIYLKSPYLKSIDCTSCQLLKLQNIAIYILKMVNVLLCKNSCAGQLKDLENKCYSIFLIKILKYVITKFQQNNDSKLETIVTLIKLGQIDQKFIAFGSSTKISSGLIYLIMKLGTEILLVIQEKIMELYFTNKYANIFAFQEISDFNNETLKILSNYFKLTKKNNPYQEIIVKEIFKSYKIDQIEREDEDSIAITTNLWNRFNDYLTVFQKIKMEKYSKLTMMNLNLKFELKYYVKFVDLILNQRKIQRLQLNLTDCVLDNVFFKNTFKQQQSLQLHTLSMINCKVMEHIELTMKYTCVKKVSFVGCQFYNIKILLNFPSLVELEINSCNIKSYIFEAYDVLAQLTSLTHLKLIFIKSHHHHNILVEKLCEKLQKLNKLESLDLSDNFFQPEELTMLNLYLKKSNIKELFLLNFYDKTDLNICFKTFLRDSPIKTLSIQFHYEDELKLKQFLGSISSNASLMYLYIKTDKQISSDIFQELRNNSKLEGVSSNKDIPNWLKNHIKGNLKVRKSHISQYYDHFEPAINYNGKVNDYYQMGLSLDGGGVRGLLLATELDYISRHVKQPLHKIFDCIGGTSIGGILALGSTGSLDGVNPVANTQDLVDIFQKYSTEIFKKSQLKQIANLFDTKYSIVSFENLLYSYFKDCKMSDALRDTNVIVTAINRLNNKDIVFKSIDAILDRNKDFFMKDMARATSAAPTYFPSAEIKNINANQKFSLLDGGVGINNPSKLVIDEVKKMALNFKDSKNNYFLLSLGTGRPISECIPEHAGIKDLAPIIDSFTESANYFVERDLTENYAGHYLRVSPTIPLSKADGQLDNTDPSVLKIYSETAYKSAEDSFSNTFAYGKFKNLSLIEWLQENTARKYDI